MNTRNIMKQLPVGSQFHDTGVETLIYTVEDHPTNYRYISPTGARYSEDAWTEDDEIVITRFGPAPEPTKYPEVGPEPKPEPEPEPEMPYGVYVARVWEDQPEKGVKWSHGTSGWAALTHGNFPAQHSHPRDFFAGSSDKPWWQRITLLVALRTPIQ